MPLDLYADELVPESTARRDAPKSGLWAIVLALVLVAGTWFYLHGDRSSPDVDPSPAPIPSPVVASGLHVLIVEETADRGKLTAGQIATLTSADLVDWYEANCAKEDGFRAYRCFDKDTKLDQENQVWRDLRGLVTLDPPCVLAVDGKRAVQFKLPADP
ncbi:MAG: hypothetical protein IT423_20580, partial [Pirellulaceae bacterium]|nr:hypothetical protein [Pirellulaceae bacterium]